jgi:hypothetical protein
MALRSFGVDIDYEELATRMETGKKTKGTSPIKMAIELAKIGMDVVYAFQPEQLPARYVTKSVTDEQARAYFKRKKWMSYVTMYDEGVKVLNRRASIVYIDKMIKKGYVAITGTRPKILARSKKNGYHGGHAIIIKRVDLKNNRVHVIDPSPYKKKSSYTIEHFESARVGNINHVVFVKDKILLS